MIVGEGVVVAVVGGGGVTFAGSGVGVLISSAWWGVTVLSGGDGELDWLKVLWLSSLLLLNTISSACSHVGTCIFAI